jgi:hypothetical protein
MFPGDEEKNRNGYFPQERVLSAIGGRVRGHPKENLLPGGGCQGRAARAA